MAVKRKAAVKKEAGVGPLTEFYTDVINNVFELKDETSGELISGPFLKLPPKKIYPDYYQLIPDPISINEIRSATIVKKRGVSAKDPKDGNGVTLDGFMEMWERMYRNASTYNDPESLIVNDARTVLDYVRDRVEKFKIAYDDIKPIVEADNTNDEDYKAEPSATNDDYQDDDEAFDSETEKAPATKKRKTVSRKKIQSEDEDEESFNEEILDHDAEDEDEDEEETENEGFKNLKKSKHEERQIEDDLFDDPNIDCTNDLMKVYRHLLSFKISHHKNSIPLSKAFMELPEKGAADTEDYYEIVTRPMCFNIVGDNLDKNVYADGAEGYKRFVKDVNQIFNNAFEVWNDGPYYKAATGLFKAFEKRIEKFETQLADKKRSKSKVRSKTKAKAKGFAEKDEEDFYPEEEAVDTQLPLDYVQPEVDNPLQVTPHEPPTFIRKHDVEKAEQVEEVDDITAFIKKFVVCTNSNLTNYSNALKATGIATSMSSSHLQKSVPSLYEYSILEPAGNSTVGGSTYSMQLPGSVVAGNEIGCSVFLDKQVIDQKYKTELRVNGELITGVEQNKRTEFSGCFCSNNYAIRVGYGLNFFEFTLKVPFPLNGEAISEENPKEFIENVKVWLNVTR